MHVKDQTYFTAYLRDVTAQKADEEELRRSRRRYRDLFERSGDAIFIHTLEGEIVDVNARAEELVGWDRRSLVGMRLPELHPEADHQAAKDAIQSVQQAGEARMEVHFIHRSGVEIPTEVNARTFEADDRTLVHGVVRDVSVRARTEAELRTAKAEAERASAAKTEFLANMSHEMRTPLNGVIGPLGLIDREGLPDEVVRSIDLAESSAESLLTLIDEVLDISHIESGRVELVEEVYAPNNLLDQVREIFTNSATDKGLTLEVEPLPQDLRVSGDPGRVRQVLFNLVGNAIKFTREGGVILSARTERTDDQDQLRFDVVDTGIGIAEEELPQLFSRFQQGAGPIGAIKKGVGLGLAICRELVHLMGGQIRVLSQPGAGSRFSVFIPTRIHKVAASGQVNAQVPTRQLHGRVLLAEDSETNVAVVSSMLAKLGIHPEIVSDGAAAVQAVESGPYDIIIMDVGMPVMDGLEASRLIRASGDATPIIALTAHALPENREQTRAAGMNGFLTKPIRLKDLARELEKWLPRAEAAHQSVLDGAVVTKAWGGDEAGYGFVLGIFLGEVRSRIDKITAHLSAGDMTKLQHEAHAIKGGASNVGAELLSHAAAQLEQACSSQQKDGEIDTRVADLKRAADVFLATANERLAGIEGDSG